VTGDLPVYLDPFIGREKDVTTVHNLLSGAGVRLVTLTGTGGVGKTRLAVHLVGLAEGDMAEGVTFVDLAPVTDPALFLPSLARALDINDPGDLPLIDRISAMLTDRRWLLVLDSFERVTPASVQLVQLLVRCPRLRVLATSRVPLRVQGEHEVSLRPFALPDLSQHQDPTDLIENDGVKLFSERARAVNPDFSLSEETALPVAEICQRLDGLPLALELAAARVRVLSPVILAKHLEKALPVLVDGRRDAPARHQTMRHAISWSVELLTGYAAAVFPRLAVFVGSWPISAATDVLTATRTSNEELEGHFESMLDAVSKLAEHGLVHSTRAPDHEPRFTMLDVVREYGLELMEATSYASDVRSAHAAWYLSFAEQCASGLSGPDQAGWMTRLHAEQGNLRAALDWSIRAVDAHTALRLGGALWAFWSRAGNLSEGRLWLERALAIEDATVTLERARAVQALGNLALEVADYSQAEAYYQESLALYRELDSQTGIGAAQTGLGLVAGLRGDYRKAREWHHACLDRWHSMGDRQREALALHNLGDLANATGASEEASDLHREALVIQQSIGDAGGVAYSTLSLGEVACDGGDPEMAEPLFEHSLTLFRQLGDDLGVGYATFGLGRVAHRRGDYLGAAGRYRDAMTMRRRFGDRRGLIECVEGLAGVAAAIGKAERAATLLAVAATSRAALGAQHPAGAKVIYDDAMRSVREAIEPSRFRSAWTWGQVLTLEEACNIAAVVADEAAPVPTAQTSSGGSDVAKDPFGLSPREREVLGLLAGRLTDKEIAAALFISPHTVHRHVTNLLVKLGVDNRREAADLAVNRGLA
jgi:predicted ATPase/DNA-binding CsgD family transcriptional regulator